jgi:hypothetical protein
MKVRKHRKHMQAKVRHGNAFNWWFDKFVRRVVEAYRPLSKALEEAYAKARNERQLQQE